MDWFPIVERLGLPLAIFIVIGWAGYKEIWKWGTDYKALVTRNDKLQAQVDRLVELAFKAAALAEKQAETIKEPGTRKGKEGE